MRLINYKIIASYSPSLIFAFQKTRLGGAVWCLSSVTKHNAGELARRSQCECERLSVCLLGSYHPQMQ